VRAHRKSKSQRILVPRGVNPDYRDVLQAVAGGQNLAFELLPYDPRAAVTTTASLETGIAGRTSPRS